MNKKLIAFSLAAGASGLLGSGMLLSAQAASVNPGGTCANQTNHSATGISQDPGAPSPAPNIYTSGGSPTGASGFVGISGSHGYLEAGGSTSGGYISGQETDASAVNGALNVNNGGATNICFSGVQVP